MHFFPKFIAIPTFEEKIKNISKHILYVIFLRRVVKMAKIGLNVAVRHVYCQIPDLLLASAGRGIEI